MRYSASVPSTLLPSRRILHTSLAAVAEVFNAVLFGGLRALRRSSRAQDYLRHRLLSQKMILMLPKASVSHASCLFVCLAFRMSVDACVDSDEIVFFP